MRKAWFSKKLFSPASKKIQNFLFLSSSMGQEDTNELVDNTSLSPPKSVNSGPVLQKTTCRKKKRQTTFSTCHTDFSFSWRREHLSSPCRPSSHHLMLTKDTEWEIQTHTSDVPHQKCAVECGCCLPALDTSPSTGLVKYLFSLCTLSHVP